MSVIQQLILSLLWVSGIKAQYGGGDSSMTTESLSSTQSTPSSSSQATANPVQSISVGEDGFTFSPDTLTVSPGDKVEFHFFPGDHSVTQASFTKPCHPLSDRSIFSGFVSTTNSEAKEVFTLIVNDTNPIWLYCAQIGHCQAGMVAVINPPMSGQDTLAAFKAAAAEMSSSSEPSSIQGGALGVPSNSSTSTSNGSTATSTAGGTFRSSSNISISTTSPTSSNTSGSSSLSSISSNNPNPGITSAGSASSSGAISLQPSNVASIIFILSNAVAIFLC